LFVNGINHINKLLLLKKMAKPKNQYRITIFNKNGYLGFMPHVPNLQLAINWIKKSNKYFSATTINVYSYDTKDFLQQIKI